VARRRVEVASCDECGSENDIESFRIASSTKTAHLDLCPVHRRPLLDIMNAGRANAAERHRVALVDYDAWLRERSVGLPQARARR
jgi:hypothetical protein